LSLAQLAARVAVAHVFWQSAQTKLASWPVTLQLFAMEYRLPLIDPAIAAPIATAAEIAGSVLILFGLFARFGALVLLGVTATIQIFVYPQSWPDHLMWASLLLLILARGAGALSLDYLAAQRFGRGA
jgi:putative oxidoreductase